MATEMKIWSLSRQAGQTICKGTHHERVERETSHVYPGVIAKNYPVNSAAEVTQGRHYNGGGRGQFGYPLDATDESMNEGWPVVKVLVGLPVGREDLQRELAFRLRETIAQFLDENA